MVKEPKKVNVSQTNIINNVSVVNNTPQKSRQQIYSENYQKNKEKKKAQQQERYQQNKEQIKEQKKINYARKKVKSQISTKQKLGKYYQAEAIKVLLSFKKYTELNQQKHKLWLDFNWTLKNCVKDIQEGFGNVVVIMKLEQVADNLIRDYWETAKKEIKKVKSWNSLSEKQQTKLIKYWGYEKARIENGYLDTAEQLETEGKEYEKELEMAKFHEERGKIKCDCWQCAKQKEIKKQILNDKEEKTKEQCPECQKWIKELDDENGICQSCKKKYE